MHTHKPLNQKSQGNERMHELAESHESETDSHIVCRMDTMKYILGSLHVASRRITVELTQKTVYRANVGTGVNT